MKVRPPGSDSAEYANPSFFGCCHSWCPCVRVTLGHTEPLIPYARCSYSQGLAAITAPTMPSSPLVVAIQAEEPRPQLMPTTPLQERKPPQPCGQLLQLVRADLVAAQEQAGGVVPAVGRLAAGSALSIHRAADAGSAEQRPEKREGPAEHRRTHRERLTAWQGEDEQETRDQTSVPAQSPHRG